MCLQGTSFPCKVNHLIDHSFSQFSDDNTYYKVMLILIPKFSNIPTINEFFPSLSCQSLNAQNCSGINWIRAIHSRWFYRIPEAHKVNKLFSLMYNSYQIAYHLSNKLQASQEVPHLIGSSLHDWFSRCQKQIYFLSRSKGKACHNWHQFKFKSFLKATGCANVEWDFGH